MCAYRHIGNPPSTLERLLAAFSGKLNLTLFIKSWALPRCAWKMRSIMMNRRSFLKAGTAAGLTLAGPGLLRAADNQPALSGQLLAMTTVAPDDRSKEISSLLRLDLATGEPEFLALPDHRFGHSILPLVDGGYFAVPYGDDDTPCLFLDAALNPRGTLAAPPGHGFGGHAAPMPDGRHLFVHFNQTEYDEPLTPEQTGQLAIVDIQTMQPVLTAPSGVLHGHDMLLTRDGRHIVVGDDGVLSSRHPAQAGDNQYPFSLEMHAPALVSFSTDNPTLINRQPLALNGCLVHITESPSGEIIGAVEQYVANNPDGLALLHDVIGDAEESFVEHLNTDVYRQELPFPGPMVRVNLKTGELNPHLAELNQAPFEVSINETTGFAVNVFTGSDMLARFNPFTGRWSYFPTGAWGVTEPRGVVDIPGTTWMAVNGFWSGIAIFDVLTMSLVRRFDLPIHGVKHMTHLAARLSP